MTTLLAALTISIQEPLAAHMGDTTPPSVTRYLPGSSLTFVYPPVGRARASAGLSYDVYLKSPAVGNEFWSGGYTAFSRLFSLQNPGAPIRFYVGLTGHAHQIVAGLGKLSVGFDSDALENGTSKMLLSQGWSAKVSVIEVETVPDPDPESAARAGRIVSSAWVRFVVNEAAPHPHRKRHSRFGGRAARPSNSP